MTPPHEHDRGARLRWGVAIGSAAICVGAVGVVLSGGGEKAVADPKPSASSGVAGAARVEEGFATESELSWLKKLRAWDERLHRALDRALTIADRDRLGITHRSPSAVSATRSAAVPVLGCSRIFSRAVGRAPTERTARLSRQALKGCRAYRGALEEILSGEQLGDDLVALVDSELDQGTLAFDALVGGLPLGGHLDLPERAGAGGTSHVEPRFSRAASEVGGKDVEVRCWSRSDWRTLLRERRELGDTAHSVRNVDGFALVGGGRVHLSPYVCRWVATVTDGELRGAEDEAAAGYALLALAHEVQHSTGVADEATATCHALQLAPELTYALDVPRPKIERLIGVFWNEYNALPEEYRSAQCRKGGELDLSPGDGVWP